MSYSFGPCNPCEASQTSRSFKTYVTDQIQELKKQRAALSSVKVNQIYTDMLKTTAGIDNGEGYTSSSAPLHDPGDSKLQGLGNQTGSDRFSQQQEKERVEVVARTAQHKRGSSCVQEPVDEKQEHIRKRNREHAKRFRARKRQQEASLRDRLANLQQENGNLNAGILALQTEQSLADLVVLDEFGDKGYNLLQRARKEAPSSLPKPQV
jgi:hypothetical protein